MKKILYILGVLDDGDMDWLVSAGEKKIFPTGDALIVEGEQNDSLYLILEGQAEVVVAGKAINKVGQGEVVGEISLLDSRPPTATVRAEEEVTTLRVRFDKLRSKMDSDGRFASHFYKAVGMFLAQRMRSVTLLAAGVAPAEGMDEDVELPDEIDPEMLDELALAGARFRMMMKRLSSK